MAQKEVDVHSSAAAGIRLLALFLILLVDRSLLAPGDLHHKECCCVHFILSIDRRK